MEKRVEIFAGVDPGQSGALAVIYPQGRVSIYDYPEDERLLASILIAIEKPTLMVMEKQNAFPGQGVVSMFNLGKNYGGWLVAIAMLDWPLQLVRPAEWKKGMGYPAKGAGAKAAKFKSESKEYSRTLARRLYPGAAEFLTRKCDHNRAEALLLAHYGRMLCLKGGVGNEVRIEEDEAFL